MEAFNLGSRLDVMQWIRPWMAPLHEAGSCELQLSALSVFCRYRVTAEDMASQSCLLYITLYQPVSVTVQNVTDVSSFNTVIIPGCRCDVVHSHVRY